MRSVCAGFSLVECIVAMLLLSVGVLALAGTSLAGMHSLERAERNQLAALHAATVLDSLILLERPAAGSQQRGPFRIDWRVLPVATGSRIDLAVHDHGVRDLVNVTGFAAQWPHRIGRIP